MVLIADSEEKLKELLDKVVEESKNKGPCINYKKTECMVVSRKNSLKCELEIGDIKIKLVKKFSFTEDGKCDTEIHIAKDFFLRLRKIQTNLKMTIKTRKRVLDCYSKTNLRYASECWKTSAQMRSKT